MLLLTLLGKPNKQRMSRVIIDFIRKTKQTENVCVLLLMLLAKLNKQRMSRVIIDVIRKTK